MAGKRAVRLKGWTVVDGTGKPRWGGYTIIYTDRKDAPKRGTGLNTPDEHVVPCTLLLPLTRKKGRRA